MSIFTPEELAQLDGLAGSMPAKKQAQQVAPLEVQADDTDVLMHALMGTEGSGPSAVSPKGATGRMQIMPDTFKDYAESGESYANEAHRVSAARRKIASDLKWANGDPALAAAAYFAGRGGAQAWANGKSDPHDGNINTTEYVRRTLAKMGIDPDQSDALVRRLSGGKGQTQLVRRLSGGKGQTQQALEDDYSSHSGAFNNGARIASDAIVAEERAKAPTAGDYLKAVQSSAVRGIGDMGRGLIGEPAAWLMNKATGTEDYEGKNLLDEAAQSYKDSMTPGGQRASAEHATGDVFDPSTWKLPDSAAGTAMMFADGIGSLASTVIPMVGIAARAQKLNKMAQIAIQSGKAAEGASLLAKARDAERLAKVAGVTTGFGTTGGAAAGEVRKNVEATIAKQDHATLYSEVPEYRRVYDRTGDEKTARNAVVNYAAQASNLLAGAFGAVGGYANAKILEDILMKRGISAALGKMTDSRIVRAFVGGLGGATAESMQETSEKVGQNMGENIGLGRPATADVSRDSFGDALGGAMVGGAMGAGGGAFSSAPARPAPQPNSPLTNAANAGTPPVSPAVPPAVADAAAPDPFAQRLSQVQFRLEDPALLTTIRNTQGLGPESVNELLGAWATARNPNTDPLIRERAMASVEAFLAQLDSRPDFTTHAPYEAGLPAVPQSANPNPGAGPGTDLTSPNDGPGPVMPHMGTGNVYDGEFSQEPDAALPRPALPAPGGISPEQRGDVRNRIASGFIRFDNNALLNPSTGERYDLPTMALRQFARNHLKQALLAAPTDVAAHDAAASQTNRRNEPTAGQKEAGNYKKGHIKVGGLDISVENPQGSARTGVDQDGETWSTIMGAHYGYVKRTTGNDGDQLDVFVKPGTPEDWNGNAFVIDQIDPKTGKFDEHKTMLGYDSEAEARAAYQANYDPSWRGLGAITAMPLQDFKTWARNEDTTKPVGKIQPVTTPATPLPESGVTQPVTQSVVDNETPVGATQTGLSSVDATQPDSLPVESAATKEPWQMTREEVGNTLNAKGWKDKNGRVLVVAPSPASGLYETTHQAKHDVYLQPEEAEQYMRDYNATAHRRHVEYALSQGKPVPAEVLAEYPDLANTGDQLATEPEDKPINPGDVSVGDTVYFTDVRDETKRIPGNFRGFNGDQVVVVWNGGQQMSLPKNRVFKNDVQTGETLATEPAQPEQTQGQAQGAEGKTEGVEPSIADLNSGRATVDMINKKIDQWVDNATNNGTRPLDRNWERSAVKRFIDAEISHLLAGKQYGNRAAAKIAVGKAVTFDDLRAAIAKYADKPVEESVQEKDLREWGENYNEVANTDDLGTVSTRNLERASNWASQTKAYEQRKGWDGGKVNDNLVNAMTSEIERIAVELKKRRPVQVTPPADTKTDKVIDDLTIPLPKAIELMTPGMRSLYKVDEVIASLPNLHTNVMISDIPDQRGVAYTTEKAMHQLLAHRGIIADQDGKLRSGNRTSATPGTLLANIKNYHATANDIRGSRQENPQMWADYAARQAEVQKLNVGDLVLTPYGGPEDPYGAPAIIVQKHTKNWKVQYTTGVESELLIPPSSLRPATADTKTDEVSTPSDAKDDKPALLAELREKLSALSARAMNAGVGALAGRIGGFTVGMKDDDANLTRAWVDQVVAGREKMVAVAEKNAAKAKPDAQVAAPGQVSATVDTVNPTTQAEFQQAIEAGKRAHFDYAGVDGTTIWIEPVEGSDNGWVVKEREDGSTTTFTKGGGSRMWSRDTAIRTAVEKAAFRFTQWKPVAPDNIQVSEPISENQTDSNAAPAESELDQRIKALGKKARDAAEILKEGGYWRNQLYTQYRGGEKFETHLHYQNGAQVKGFGFATLTEMKDAGVLTTRDVQSSTVYPTEWVLRDQPLTQPVTTTETQNAASEATGKQTGGEAQTTETVRGSEGEGISRKGMYGPWGLEDIEAGNVALIPLSELLSANTNEDYAIVGLRRVNNALSARDASLVMSIPGMERAELPDSLYVTVNDRGASPLETESFTVDYYGKSVEIQKTQIAEQDTVFGLAPIAIDEDAGRYFAYQVGNDPQLYDFIDAVEQAFAQLVEQQSAATQDVASERTEGTTPSTIEPAPEDDAKAVDATQNATAHRETQRVLFNELSSYAPISTLSDPVKAKQVVAGILAKMAEDGEAIGGVTVDNLPDDFWKAVARRVERLVRKEELEKNRDPEIYRTALANGMVEANVGEDADMQTAFKQGWDHALSGGTASTLSGNLLGVITDGYNRAQAWIADGQGKAWFTGKRAKKLENTGPDLRRWYEQAAKTLAELDKADIQKAWKQIEDATVRSEVFNPALSDTATPGARRWSNDLRDKILPFKEWLSSVYGPLHSMYGNVWRKDSASSRVEKFLAGTGTTRETDNIAREDRPQMALSILQAAAQKYLDKIHTLSTALDGAGTVAELATKFDALVNDGRNLSDFGSEFRTKYTYSTYRGYNFEPDGRTTRHHQSSESEEITSTRATPLTRPKLDSIRRSGKKDYRQGKNVSPVEFQDTFKFASVGFGKWVAGKQDQNHLNYAYDAFMDLADVLGIQPENIGLGGTLHFTVGALGRGKHSAHFSPDQPSPDGAKVAVINLTNTRGDGAVAHEWLHALDWHLGGGKANGEAVAVVTNALSSVISYEELGKVPSKFIFGGWRYTQLGKKATPIDHATMAIDRGTYGRPVPTQFKKDADALGKGAEDNYWARAHELFARAGEAWVFDQLADAESNYLVSDWVADGYATKETGYRGRPYPTGEDRTRFARYFRAFFDALTWSDTGPTADYAQVHALWRAEMAEFEQAKQEMLDSLPALYEQHLAQQKAESTRRLNAEVANTEAEGARLAEEQKRREEERQRLELERALTEKNAKPDMPVSDGLSDDELEALFDEAESRVNEEQQEVAVTQPFKPARDYTGRTWKDANGDTRRVMAYQGGDTVTVGTLGKEGWVQMTPAEVERDIAAGKAAQSDSSSGRGGKVRDTPKPDSEPQTAPDSAAGLIAEAAKLGVKGIDEALTGLAKLFGSPGRLNSFPGGFDQDTYNQAKPHFEASLAAFKAAGRTLVDLFAMLLREYGSGIRPYATKFAKEQKLGRELNQEDAKNDVSTPQTESGINDRPSDAGPRTEDVPLPPSERGTVEGDSGTGGSSGGDLRGNVRPGEGQGADQQDGLPGERSSPDDGAPASGGNRTGTSDGIRDGRTGKRSGRDGVINFNAQPGQLERTGSWRDTAARNLDIVQLVKQLDSENRMATPEEQAQLARYVGWGAGEIRNKLFPGTEDVRGSGGFIFDPTWADGAWKPLVERVMALLTPEELNTALRSTQYAHFTGESISRPIWRGIQRLGFNGGKILEPGMGTGNFPITAPAELMEASSYTGIEMDHMTAAIAKQLLPQENILQADFVKQRLPKNFFDLAAGNPPFADISITDDPAYKKHRFMLHDYFFAKSLDSVRPGGMLVFITSSGTMDKKNDRARQFMADRADLLGAIRLPQTAFKDSAGTEVVTDILFLQKRQPGVQPAGQQWLGHANVQTKDGEVMVNEYFAAHPEMVLGEFRISGNYDEDGNRINSLNRIGQTVVVPHKGIEIGAALDRAIDSLPEGVYQATVAKDSETLRQESAERDFDPKLKKEGGVYLHDKKGTLLRVENGVGVPLSELEKFTPAQAEWMRDYVGLRDAIKNAQFDQLNDGEWEKSLAKLNKVYDKFVAKHGLIQSFTSYDKTETDEDGVERTIERRRYKNKKVLGFDVESPLVESLEKITEDGHIVKAPFLLGRTIKKPTRPVIKTLQDALMVSLDEKGTLDLAHVANLANRQEQEVIDELGDLIFESPSGGWQMGDEYLSDDVVTKLEEAEQAAAMDPRFQRNVQALILVQPKPLEASDVTLALGMRWIPPSVITRFAVEHLGMETRVTYDDIRHEWSVAGADGTGSRAARNKASEWGITGRRSDFEMLDTVLNQRDLSISETVPNGHGGTKTQKDQAATARAQKIAEDMQKAFATWVWTDVDRARNLLALYNRKYNNIAPRKFDGSHLTLPGLSLRYTLHPHQKRAVWRIIQTGNTYTAHAVGAGKSLEMIVSAMEQKRLGLINKPLFVVPNHMLEQMSNEFMDAYPMANIMVADEENFHTSNRRRFIAQAALNNPDAIIITHAAFAKLSVKPETAQRVVDKLVAEMAVILQDMPDGTVAEKKHRKQIEKRIEDMERRFLGKADDGTKDQVLNFEDLGVDFLYMDEAHEFRRLEYATNRGQVKGISPDGSVRALDLYIKTRWLEQQRPGRSMVLASGTPVTNTMAELFSIMRYLDEEALENDDISRFDEWAAMFGEVKGNFERDASGVYQFVDRFSKFKNVPELMKRVRRFMDVLTMSQLGGLVQRPDISTGQPQMVVGEETEQSRIYRTTTLASRLESSKAWKPSPSEPNNPDPIINIITDGRLAAIDPRYVLPHAKNDPTSKLNVMIDGVIKSYQDNKNNVYLDPVTGKPEPIKGATHLVFSSVGFGEQVQANRGFDVRGHMMRRFKEAGIPAAEVAFRADFASHAKKEALFKDMRSGKIKILIGSPKNMGTGLNVQRRLKSLHFMSPPWYPADVEQPHGRILRQGNQNAEADIYWYSTKGTYDSTMWNMVARKSRFIEQAFSGDDSVRTIDDISESSQYEMASALSAGDERAIQLAGYTADIERLERLREAHFKEQSELHWRKSSTEHAVQYTAKNIEKIKKAISDRPENYWTLKVDFDGVELVKPSEIGERLLKDMDAALAAWDEKTKDKQTQFVMGKAFGKNPIIAKMKTVDHYKNGLSKYGTIALLLGDMHFDLNDEWASQFQAVFDATGFGRRVSSAMSAPDRALTAAENRLDEETANLKQINAKLGTPFSGERELDELVSEKAQLELAMAEEGKAQQAAQQPAAAIPDDAMSRNDAGTSGMPIDDVRAFVEVLASKWRNAGRIHVYARPEDLGRMGEREQEILAKIEEAGALRSVNGYYSDGDIYLFANHLNGLQDVQKVLLHEATHMGLSGMFGRGLDAVMISLYQGNRTIHAEANKIMGRYDGMTRVKAVYEVLAEMGGDGIEASVWDKLVAFVRGWMRRAGMDLTISDAEIRSLVTKALAYTQNTPSAGAAYGASAMSRTGDSTNVAGGSIPGMTEDRGPGADLTNQPTKPGSEEPEDGYVRLYTGSGELIKEIHDGGVFGGVFASRRQEAADSHGFGDGRVTHFMDVSEDKVAESRDLDESETESIIRGELREFSEDEYDEVYRLVVRDKSVFTSEIREDRLLEIFRSTDLGEAAWETQRVRGFLAKKLGFQAVEMDDEHGTSYLVFPGVSIRPVSDIDPSFSRSGQSSGRDTITVDGKERSRLNSNGKPIAQTDEALVNFWKWFGDSKVVDDHGRPLVVYHGSKNAGFTEFEVGESGAIFTSPDDTIADSYSTGSTEEPYLFAREILDDMPDSYTHGADYYETGVVVNDEFYESKEDAEKYYDLEYGDALEVGIRLYSWSDEYGHSVSYEGNENGVLEHLHRIGPGVYSLYVNARSIAEIDWGDNQWDSGPNGETTNEAVAGASDADAVVIKNVYDHGPGYGNAHGTVIAVFDPGNVKSTRNIGTFDPSDTDILKKSAFDEDMESQSSWMQDKAKERGFKDVDELFAKKPQALIALAEQWRQDHPAAVETVAHKIEEPANPGRRNFIKQTTALVAWSYAGKSFSQPAGLKEMLRAGDLPAAIAWLAQNASNKDSRTLAKKLAPLMAGIDLQVIKVGQEYPEGFPAALASSYGVTSVNNKTGKVRIFLREPKASDGLNGLTEETVLHEALHAAILNRYGALSRRGAKVLYGNAAKMLPGDDAILRIVKLWQEYGTYLEQKGLNTGKSPAWMTEPYKSVDELITYALTNPEFQAWMKKTEFNKQGAWRRFVSAVRSFLGLDGSPPDTYLGAIMDATYSMLDAAKQVKQGAFLQASSNSVDVFSHAGDSRIRDIMGDARIDTSLWGPGFANLPPDTPADGMRQHANTVPEGWIRPLTDRVSRMFRNTDKFNWRDTSIHSQLHKAAKNPYFAETFSRVQQFMNDASRAALRPSERAPTVLPRIDVVSSIMPAIRGLLKGKEAAADIDAAHLAVLRGTLSDTIYDDAEQAGLTEAQWNIYKEFRDAIDASLEELAAGEAWKMASTLFSPEEQADKMTMKTAIINSPESAETTLRDMLAERRAEIALRMQAAEDTGRAVNPDDQAAMDRIEDVSERLDKIFERVAQLKNDGYAPLMRFGQYSLHLYRIDPITGRQEEDENGEKVSEYFGLFESESERDTALKTMREEYAGDQGMQFEHGTVSKEQWKLYRGVSPETVALFAEAIGIEQDEVFQEWYRKAASNRSALKRLIHRKGTPGFSTDGARVLSSFVTSNGRRAAQQYHMGDILESIENFPKGQGIEQDEAVKMVDYIQDPQEEMGALRAYMFFHYLGGTLSNFFLNSTQPAMMTLPYLARDVGMKEAMRVLKDAYKFAWKNDGMSPEIANALSNAEDAGVVAAQQIHHLWNETARPLVNKLGRFGENAAYRAHSFMQLWGMPFSLAEHMNRRVTFIAAYNAARNRGLGSDAAYGAAVDAVNETQIIYDKSNRPNWARGNIGSLIFTFKLFSISYVELATRLMRSGPNGKMAAMYMLGLLVLASGLQGLPGSDDLDDLLDTIAQLMGYNVSTTAAKRKWLENLAGEEAGRMLMYGISTLTPLDLHSRLGMGNLLPATAMFKPSNDRKFEDALEIIGPAGGLMRSYIDATEAIETGNLSKASEAMLPKFFRDMKQGIEAGINGEYRDRNGRKVDDVSAAEAFVKSIGFQPQSISMQGKIGWQVQQRVAFARKRETAIVSEWARRIVDGDPGAAAIAFSQRDEWNQQNPDTPIAIKRSQAARRVKEMRADKNERLLKSVPRELKEMAQEEME